MVSDRSNGIYQSVIAAIVGWLILVGNAQAQPISNRAGGDAAAIQSNQKATQHADIASGIRRIGNQLEAQTAKSDPYEKERNEREIRDLQAQENSAYWAGAMFWATLGALVLSVIGVGLVWTTFRETRKANEIAIFAQRPWISIEATPTIMTTKANSYTWEYLIYFKNLGSTVAKNFSFKDEIVFILPDSLDTKKVQWGKWDTPIHETKSVIMPGDIRNAPGSRTFKDDSISWLSMGTVKPREVMPVIVVSAFYQGSDDNVWHRTDQAFRIGMRGEYYVGTAINENIVELKPPELIGIPYGATLAT